MTLIVGVLCDGGIVMAADGAATLGVPGQMNTAKQSVRKLSLIGDSIIIGAAGAVGLSQRFVAEMKRLHDSKDKVLRNTSPELFMSTVRLKFWEHVKAEIEAATTAKGLFGPAAQVSAISQTMLALPIGNQCCLFQFDRQCAPEMATVDLPFIAIGGGQFIADPFLAFLRRALWGHRDTKPGPLPTLGDGIAAAVWTLDHAIKTNPGGVADPIQIALLSRQEGGFLARELSERQVDEHRQAADEMERRIRPIWESLRGRGESGPPPEPVPTPAQ